MPADGAGPLRAGLRGRGVASEAADPSARRRRGRLPEGSSLHRANGLGALARGGVLARGAEPAHRTVRMQGEIGPLGERGAVGGGLASRAVVRSCEAADVARGEPNLGDRAVEGDGPARLGP
ncbi:MAG: hypothetical protein D6705_13945 [Deltaproteobacteria bacterium]|nr:MAG: hypothetical protein D6705_13945 [Deltaproteobacteria bacterium]